MKDKQRSITADVIRGFAIITVVLGHCIQQGNGLDYYNNSMYWFNKAYQFIYSFHMPLFMLLAGWFAYYSMKKIEGNRKQQGIFLLKRACLYIFPILFWTFFEFARGYIVNIKLGNENAPISDLVPQFFKYFITNLWFLWAILLCLIIVFVMHFYLKDNIYLYAIGFLGLFVITDNMNLGVYKYLMPYYISAFYANMYKDKLMENEFVQKMKKNYWILIGVFAIAFAVLFAFYNDIAFIYRSGYRLSRVTLIKQTVIDMYRMIIGYVGSGFFMLLLSKLVDVTSGYKWPLLSAFGKNSLGVYILQGYFILLVMTNYTNGLNPSWVNVVIETIVISAVSLICSIIIDKIPVIRCIIGKSPFTKNK